MGRDASTTVELATLMALPGMSTASALATQSEQALAVGHVLPVLPALRELFPDGGLRRGSTIAVHDSTALLFSLIAQATTKGAWAAAVGLPRLGLLAAQELGVKIDRLALIPQPKGHFVAVMTALLEGMDLVLVPSLDKWAAAVSGDPTRLAQRLSERARHRGAIVLSLGPWPGAQLELRCLNNTWHGLAEGHGQLHSRVLEIEVRGRGAAARPRRQKIVLPDHTGSVTIDERTDSFGHLRSVS